MGTDIYCGYFGDDIFNSVMMIYAHEAVWRNDADIITSTSVFFLLCPHNMI